jgi:hypothetical protein
MAVRISKAAEHMGCCRRHALRVLLTLQAVHRDIEILIPRTTPTEKWRVNLHGLIRARELDGGKSPESTENRLESLESDLRLARQKINRLQIRVSQLENSRSVTGLGG